MKKYSILFLVLVLTAFSLVGCRNPNKPMEPTTVPTTHATTAPTAAPTVAPTTEATHQPTEHTGAATNATEHTDVATVPGDVVPDTTNAAGEGRARQMPRNH
ncbi:MAG: hypothetical protein IJ375_02370 [Oscillospiraceae bacterium]|nr:hypothetical protein [Oscillospiraceae bacterium]